MMKRLITILTTALIIFSGCSGKAQTPRIIENSDGSVNITRIEEDGKAELVCHFCNKKYEFSKEELEDILEKNKNN